ncbi:MAG: hypothetical protein AB1446_12200 [Bacillota bacterium]
MGAAIRAGLRRGGRGSAGDCGVGAELGRAPRGRCRGARGLFEQDAEEGEGAVQEGGEEEAWG